ncbi:MAG: hypothetical protein JWN14_3127 [Chthonomonadales bacterium]|nr:hypothetical protein [Chthonomonadales bacterium]
MKFNPFACLVLMVGLFVAGCGGGNDNSGPVGCSANIENGITVRVVDAVTNANIATGATGTIQDGSYTETLQPTAFDGAGNVLYMTGAPERTGTYTIRINKTGYAPFVLQNVTVTKNVCHVNVVNVIAPLQPVIP